MTDAWRYDTLRISPVPGVFRSIGGLWHRAPLSYCSYSDTADQVRHFAVRSQELPLVPSPSTLWSGVWDGGQHARLCLQAAEHCVAGIDGTVIAGGIRFNVLCFHLILREWHHMHPGILAKSWFSIHLHLGLEQPPYCFTLLGSLWFNKGYTSSCVSRPSQNHSCSWLWSWWWFQENVNFETTCG
jgi:hypothetical protein